MVCSSKSPGIIHLTTQHDHAASKQETGRPQLKQAQTPKAL